MITSTEKPKLYDILHRKFGVKWEDGIAISYKDTVYSKNPVQDDIRVHEQKHLDQQNDPQNISPDVWWNRYLTEDDFRLKQEVEAYRAQVEYLKVNHHKTTRNERRYMISKFAVDLCSGMYGFIVDYKTALEMIK